MGLPAKKLFVEPKTSSGASNADKGFTYNADAEVLQATITQPIVPGFAPNPTKIVLAPDGKYQTQAAPGFRLGNIYSYTGGYTQVSGFQNPQGAFVTLATAVIEGLNILEILTADRVVAQITTTLLPGNEVPSVSFLGSRFENLRIGDQPIEVSVNQYAMGLKPAGDGSYFKAANLPAGMAVSDDKLTGSIVTATSLSRIVVPSIGTVTLGELVFTRKRSSAEDHPCEYVYDVSVVMIHAKLSGGGVEGDIVAAAADPNGTTHPPKQPPPSQ